MTPVDDEAAAATWTKMVSASTTAHGEPNMDDIKRPILVPILMAGDAIATHVWYGWRSDASKGKSRLLKERFLCAHADGGQDTGERPLQHAKFKFLLGMDGPALQLARSSSAAHNYCTEMCCRYATLVDCLPISVHVIYYLLLQLQPGASRA